MNADIYTRITNSIIAELEKGERARGSSHGKYAPGRITRQGSRQWI